MLAAFVFTGNNGPAHKVYTILKKESTMLESIQAAIGSISSM